MYSSCSILSHGGLVGRTSERSLVKHHVTFASPRTLKKRYPIVQSIDEANEDDQLELQRQQLTRSLDLQPMSGEELRSLVFNKWNRSYDVRLQRRGKRMYLHVMWKHLEQKSFHLTPEEYELQLEAVADYINLWGVADVVRQGINSAKHAPGYITGGNAKAYSIPLGVDIGSGRSDEWNSF